jgi:hypothetical protein
MPADEALTKDSHYLYVLNELIGTIDGFRVERDGSLTSVGRVGGLPPNAQGLAAR